MTDWERGELLYDSPGTLEYAPPEILTDQPYDGERRDVWSVGIVAYVMLAKYTPFAGPCERMTRYNICRGALPAEVMHFGYPAQDFIWSCLTVVRHCPCVLCAFPQDLYSSQSFFSLFLHFLLCGKFIILTHSSFLS